MVQLFNRFELKYPVDVSQAEAIRRVLLLRCAVDRTGLCDEQGRYRIDSLYLDTPGLRCLRDVQEGRPVRFKMRIRTYPDTTRSVVRIEVKRRVGDLIRKTSAVVPHDRWQTWLDAGADLSKLPLATRESLNAFVTMQREMDAAPKVLIRYLRQAFCSRYEDYVRITLDSGLQFQRAELLDLTGIDRRWTPVSGPCADGSVLMEVKFKERPPIWVADLVKRFGLVNQGFSKYRTSMECAQAGPGRWWNVPPGLAYARRGEALSWTC
jgi:hypothetical protein